MAHQRHAHHSLTSHTGLTPGLMQKERILILVAAIRIYMQFQQYGSKALSAVELLNWQTIIHGCALPDARNPSFHLQVFSYKYFLDFFLS